MGILDTLFGGGGGTSSYGNTVKKDTVPDRLTRTELKKLLWQLHDYIDYKERDAILAAFPGSAYFGRYEIKKKLWKLRDEHKISRTDMEKFLGALDEYF